MDQISRVWLLQGMCSPSEPLDDFKGRELINFGLYNLTSI